jgi:ribosomal protein L5
MKVTIRKEKAVNFFNKLLWLVWPRDPSFKGLQRSCWQNRTMSFGFTRMSYFPEIRETKNMQGLNVNIIFKEEMQIEDLLKHYFFPIKK